MPAEFGIEKATKIGTSFGGAKTSSKCYSGETTTTEDRQAEFVSGNCSHGKCRCNRSHGIFEVGTLLQSYWTHCEGCRLQVCTGKNLDACSLFGFFYQSPG